jgi:hypothetical protein
MTPAQSSSLLDPEFPGASPQKSTFDCVGACYVSRGGRVSDEKWQPIEFADRYCISVLITKECALRKMPILAVLGMPHANTHPVGSRVSRCFARNLTFDAVGPAIHKVAGVDRKMAANEFAFVDLMHPVLHYKESVHYAEPILAVLEWRLAQSSSCWILSFQVLH